MKTQKLAIVGSGFAGLATCWHLQKLGFTSITIFDAKDIGQGTSSIATGLLHRFCGPKAKKPWNANLYFEKAIQLIKETAPETFSQTGMLRPACNKNQLDKFQACAKNYHELQWWPTEKCQEMTPGLAPLPGLFIKDAIAVHCSNYIKSLWKACHKNGAKFQKAHINSLKSENIKDFDTIILTTGAETNSIQELNRVPISVTKGQLFEIEWPTTLPPLKYTLNSNIHFMMHPSKKTCFIGATYERDIKNNQVTINLALEELKRSAFNLFPALKEQKIICYKAGIRASIIPNQRRPVLGKFDDKTYLFTGLSSKGLLYHAYLAELLALFIATGNRQALPEKVRLPKNLWRK